MDSGILYVVATPIGNLDDFTLRAVSTLRRVDLVAAEDTRSAAILFDRHDIDTPTRSYHDHNKEAVTPALISHLEEGRDLAIISEAGTPGVSDPGFYLVREAHRSHIPVIPIPGPCAAVAALSASGLPSDRFYCLGFLPRGEAGREQLGEAGLAETSLIIYESAGRIVATLQMLTEVLGERTVVLSREISKVHEEHLVGTPTSLMQKLRERNARPRGEITLVIAPAGFDLHGEADSTREEVGPADDVVLQQVHLLVQSGYRLTDAARLVARGHNLPRSDLYRQYVHRFRPNQ